MASQILLLNASSDSFARLKTPALLWVSNIVRWNRSYPKLPEIRPQPDAHVFSP
jgi:hypothetical protein